MRRVGRDREKTGHRSVWVSVKVGLDTTNFSKLLKDLKRALRIGQNIMERSVLMKE